MDTGVAQGLYTGVNSGLYTGTGTGIDRGLNNGVLNEVLIPNGIVKNGLVLYLDAANPYSYPGSGTTWYDLSGSANNFTLTNGPYFKYLNKGIVAFDGGANYAVKNSFNNSPQSNLTLLIWLLHYSDVKFAQNRTPTLYYNQYGLDVVSDYLNFYDYDTDATGFGFSYGVSSDKPLVRGVWNYIGFVKNVTSGTYYINGKLAGSFTAARNVTYGNTNHVIGGDIRNLATYLNGAISTYSVYNKSLTAAEISQNYLATKQRFGL